MGNRTEKLQSALDASVNFVTRTNPGMLEARYVRRRDDYFVAYLSSQTGCDKACRFCHLTQSGQTAWRDAELAEYLEQAEQVFAHYDWLVSQGEPKARAVHFNFMARGEVFANRNVRERGPELVERLSALALSRGLVPRLKFSTIMPEEMADVELTEIFGPYNPDVYLSLYSVDPVWRRRWMPKALPAETALAKLARYQKLTRKIPVLHWALIEGENDSEADIEAICDAVRGAGLRCDFNLVRYNPYSPKQGREPAEEVIRRAARQLEASVPGARVKVVSRVGFDVKASCGMFVPGPDRRGRVRAPEPVGA